jgi:hypothetical protein
MHRTIGDALWLAIFRWRKANGEKTAVSVLAALSARGLPEFALGRGRRESRMRKPHPQPRVDEKKTTRVSPLQVRPDRSGFPRASGFNGCFVLFPAIGLSCRRRRRDARASSAGLISASRYQNHTTSPYVSVRFVSHTSSVHRSPHPTFVTIAKRPSLRGTGRASLWN